MPYNILSFFCDGADGYHFNIKLMNPATNKEMNKKCSAMHYYSYRLMIRQDEDNFILKYRQWFQQYIVDMYAKIESERLLFIRLNQTKLRSEQYIHSRDAVVNDGNTSNVGRLTIFLFVVCWQSMSYACICSRCYCVCSSLWSSKFFYYI